MWRLFQRDEGRQKVSIAVSDGVLDAPDRPDAPEVYVVRWPMEAPGELGMGDPSESEAVGPVEEALWEAVEDAGGERVARIRGGGVWTLVARGEGLPWELLVDVASGILGRAPEVEIPEDALDWLVTHVLPSDEERSWMDSAEVVSQLVLFGIDPSEPMEIRHHVFAPDGGDLAAFVAAAPGGPYAIEAIEADPEHDVPEGMVLSHEMPAELGVLQPVVWALTCAARDRGLVYDGWEAAVGEEKAGLLELMLGGVETAEA